MRDFGQDPSPAATTSTHKGKLIISVIVLLAIAIAVVFYLAKQQESAQKPEIKQPAPTAQESKEAQPEPDPKESTELDEPIPEISETVELEPEPEAEPEQPLPEMAESTSAVLDELKAAEQNVEPITGQQLIRDTVVFVDNLRQGLVIREKALIAGPTAAFRVLEQNGKIYIDPRSYDRYNPMVDWFVSLDTEVLVSLFERYQPLVKQALGEIGYPDQDPNEMLLEAINVLLETPSVGTVIELNDDSVMYRYADPTLEALPAAQKQMLRTGPDNIRRIKLKLEAIQEALTQ
ncbi:DUF3014 domain-containing protein [Pseudidiomarina marina]|uniref:DUF3014 domain-containing protein n=1 Tax=Pseudidiomarina marina TaxID=502366 RepID=UPI00385018D7